MPALGCLVELTRRTWVTALPLWCQRTRFAAVPGQLLKWLLHNNPFCPWGHVLLQAYRSPLSASLPRAGGVKVVAGAIASHSPKLSQVCYLHTMPRNYMYAPTFKYRAGMATPVQVHSRGHGLGHHLHAPRVYQPPLSAVPSGYHATQSNAHIIQLYSAAAMHRPGIRNPMLS